MRDRGVDPDVVVAKLIEFIATAPPQVLSQIRPIPLAQQLALDAGERIEVEVSHAIGDYLIRGPRLVGQQRLRESHCVATIQFARGCAFS